MLAIFTGGRQSLFYKTAILAINRNSEYMNTVYFRSPLFDHVYSVCSIGIRLFNQDRVLCFSILFRFFNVFLVSVLIIFGTAMPSWPFMGNASLKLTMGLLNTCNDHVVKLFHLVALNELKFERIRVILLL